MIVFSTEIAKFDFPVNLSLYSFNLKHGQNLLTKKAKLKDKCDKTNDLKRITLVSNGTVCRTHHNDLILTAILFKHLFHSAAKVRFWSTNTPRDLASSFAEFVSSL